MPRVLIGLGSLAAVLHLTILPAYAQSGPGGVPVPPAVMARDATGHITVRAVRIVEPIVVDGRLDDPVYREIPPIDGFVQQLPDEGAPASEPTEIWIFFDDRNIYLAARCWDSQPDRMVANEMARDSRALWRNDAVSVLFDTFHDRRNGIGFMVNPLGGLFDNLVTDERNVNSDWNTVWDAKTSLFDEGWIVEMVIPFKSLRYQPGGAQTWGVNISRRVQWKNETSFLSPVPASLDRRGMLQISAAATLVGIEPPTTSRNLEVKPYAISGALTDRDATPATSNDVTGDLGVDVKYGLTRSLIADFTVNTDFAQVEADEQQVNLTRFSLFFPEKREFFLEGQGIFAFGSPNDTRRRNARPSDTPVIFFSRRIGLDGGEEVPILAGGRMTGRAGAYSVGLLNIQTGDSETADALSTNFSVVRLKRDLLRRSNVGLIYTRRSQLIDTDGINQVYGADANFRFYENVNLSSYYARTDTPGIDADGGDASYRGRFEYTGDRYGVEVEGEFNWSSQHLDDEVLRCRDGNGDGQTGRVGLRCVRLVGRRQRGVRSSNGSGRRSRGGCRVRRPLCPVACRRPWVVVGSVRAVVCRRSAWRPDRLATCPWRSGKRSRSCERRAPGCVTLPVGSGEPRRLSRESYVATRRLGAAVWRIGRRLRSGTAPDVPSARR